MTTVWAAAGISDRVAVLDLAHLADLLGIQSERGKVDLADGHDVGSVGLVEVGQEGKVLGEVRVDRAILQRGVRGGVVGERRHLDLDARRLGLATRLDTGLLGIYNNEL
jgi:hypothetical protein